MSVESGLDGFKNVAPVTISTPNRIRYLQASRDSANADLHYPHQVKYRRGGAAAPLWLAASEILDTFADDDVFRGQGWRAEHAVRNP